MPNQARYYLGRVVKQGMMTDDLLADALRNPVVVQRHGFHYTFTQIDLSPDRFYARLSKFKAQGEVEVVEESEHLELTEQVPGLLVASSPFVYLPSFSGIAYRHIWNKLERSTFEAVFRLLVEEKQKNFMVGCTIEPVSDIGSFAARLARLDRINFLKAQVHPPNPLYSPLWRSISEYMRDRGAATLELQERAQRDEGLETQLPELARQVSSGAEVEAKADSIEGLIESSESRLTDAAILMASDGYGKGVVYGSEGERKVVIRTRETQVTIRLDADVTPDELQEAAESRFAAVSKERDLDD